MLQNTPENKHLPGEHPRYNRKLSACGSIMTLWGCVKFTYGQNDRSRPRHVRWRQMLPPD
ncbi:hypothetical protein DNM18_20555 [Salmonella enterica subsp. enterica]|nr:hypothetical protein [Salmonella enterica subsp. enterica serovar Poona]EBU7355242.1 hypothetical protein [Salmonella enterica subsp. enterica serovar Poona]ECA2557198.1 hypothetical protein [Salmonella enterica subsp. enterica serovar Poona]ECD3886567.1 hypothetical protein [Salmonella enterica subsp. enterica serovar Poona]